MRRLLLLLLLNCGAVHVFATPDVEVDGLTGFNVGADLVKNWSTARNYSNYGDAFDGTRLYVSREVCFSKLERNKIDLAFNLGYAHKFSNNFWSGISGEVFLGRKKRNTTVGFYEDGVEEESVNGCSYSLKVKGGYYAKDLGAVFYGILGLRWMNVDFKLTQPMELECVKLRKTMPLLGVGFEKKVHKHLSIVFEWEHFWQNSNSTVVAVDPQTVDPNITNVSQRFQSSFSANSVRIGCKYYFGNNH